jgi:hypothetical protein
MADIGEALANMVGDPQMGKVYDSTVAYPALTKNTAQFQQVDPAGAAVSNGEGRIPTYSAATVAYSPYASATDVLIITGSATKTVRVKRVAVSGRSTSASNIDVSLYKHTVTANTTGTPTNLTIVSHDSVINPSATAVVSTYGSAPTIGGTTGLMRCQQSNLSAAGSGGAATPVEWHFGDVNDQSGVLHGVTEQMAVNLGGGSVPTGAVLNMFIEWSEE